MSRRPRALEAKVDVRKGAEQADHEVTCERESGWLGIDRPTDGLNETETTRRDLISPARWTSHFFCSVELEEYRGSDLGVGIGGWRTVKAPASKEQRASKPVAAKGSGQAVKLGEVA